MTLAALAKSIVAFALVGLAWWKALRVNPNPRTPPRVTTTYTWRSFYAMRRDAERVQRLGRGKIFP